MTVKHKGRYFETTLDPFDLHYMDINSFRWKSYRIARFPSKVVNLTWQNCKAKHLRI